MKMTVLLGLLLTVMAVKAQASVYTCNSSDFGNAKISISSDLKKIVVNKEDYGQATAKVVAQFDPRNPKWEGCKKYDFGNMPFGEDGISSFLINKEMLAGKATGFAQYRNTWDSYTSITMPCKRVK